MRPSALTTGVLMRMPELDPAAIATCCANGPARERDDRGVHRPVVLRIGRALLVVQQPLELGRSLRSGEVRGRLRAHRAQLALQLRVLRLRAREAVEVAVCVAERTRDALRRDLERPQDARARALHAVEHARGRRAEGDGQERERAEHEQREHEAAEHGAARPANGVFTRPGALDRRAQHRHPRGAVRGCHMPRLPGRPEERVLFGRTARPSNDCRCGGRCGGGGPCSSGGSPRTPRGCAPSRPRRT